MEQYTRYSDLIIIDCIVGKIPQNKCPLYIAGRGQGFDRLNDFYGYLDNVSNLIKCIN